MESESSIARKAYTILRIESGAVTVDSSTESINKIRSVGTFYAHTSVEGLAERIVVYNVVVDDAGVSVEDVAVVAAQTVPI